MSEAKNEAFDQAKWGQEMDPDNHLGTWDGFMTASKWGTGAVAVVLILMALFLL